jgi:tetratricopeptide (TPR) repeat protein
MFMRAETEKVPVARLVTNLEQRIALQPKDAGLHAKLARLHSMAYALKTDQYEMDKRNQEPFFGYTDTDKPPREVTKIESVKAVEEGKQHLQQAIAEYQQALALDPKHLASRLGLGWCLDQAGDKTAALTHYRQAIAQAWAKESKGEGGLDTPVTVETVNYIIPLLDPSKDAVEIARIKGYKVKAEQMPRAVTPILVPLEAGAPLEALVDPKAAVTFDLDGSGRPRQWGWITPKAAWLVYDAEDSGRITSGLQLFGSVTFWVFWGNGYEALAALDNNGDGELRGDELCHLALWHDANGNGVSDAGEVRPLAEWGITALSCCSQTHRTGIPFQPRGVTFQDGTTRPSYDWSPAQRQ